MISMILIEDETLLRMLLRKAMETDGRFQTAREAADGERGLALCLETRHRTGSLWGRPGCPTPSWQHPT